MLSWSTVRRCSGARQLIEPGRPSAGGPAGRPRPGAARPGWPSGVVLSRSEGASGGAGWSGRVATGADGTAGAFAVGAGRRRVDRMAPEAVSQSGCRPSRGGQLAAAGEAALFAIEFQSRAARDIRSSEPPASRLAGGTRLPGAGCRSAAGNGHVRPATARSTAAAKSAWQARRASPAARARRPDAFDRAHCRAGHQEQTSAGRPPRADCMRWISGAKAACWPISRCTTLLSGWLAASSSRIRPSRTHLGHQRDSPSVSSCRASGRAVHRPDCRLCGPTCSRGSSDRQIQHGDRGGRPHAHGTRSSRCPSSTSR